MINEKLSLLQRRIVDKKTSSVKGAFDRSGKSTL